MQPTEFGNLPVELFLSVLDQLVATRDGHQPVAFAPSDSVTRTLRSLTLVSKSVYFLASRYLYSHCVYLDNRTNYRRFRRALGFDPETNPESLKYGQAGRHKELFTAANIKPQITSLFISPQQTDRCMTSPGNQLPQVIDVLMTIGPSLKRLVVNFQHFYMPGPKSPFRETNTFLSLFNLEELVCSDHIYDFFKSSPPNLKRLAITGYMLDRCYSWSSLGTVFVLRTPFLDRSDIQLIFELYRGKSLDLVLIDVSANHQTPPGTREWKDDDTVRIWEIDVPKSYYGDENDLALCESWVWERAVAGTLFTQEKRRMRSWKQVQESLVPAEQT